ncbi:Lrp/AsnC family transcriptional regulator [Massilia antarctica]|uniref:Lrp/AsnC family transcriptional regulator n=1 Tax=Massilia antarctica TaxID=2765360 RepID=A0AA48WG39_9BURK|nr:MULTISPECIES: Lrp/AsnC family transcriptional regulator [Massilia]MCY0911810.1 Lrp/AsnC family transcriptional regulator [Massilia sp. H27-R4]QPI51791.1 Lrp/AsnC family transcriptional regulator [Massilia antarctica]CUI06735.1 Transcriptional regulator, AsnC family [Janthinobacterium sp. CG23_2]CUU30521.1 Transcriptional regulator, AsnC family [Janthinobacterium sp. CG23_2]
MSSLDKYDCAILAALQADGTLSIAALSEKVGLSSTPCWKRVKRLEEEGYIQSRVSIIDRDKVGLPVTVFVSVRTTEHDEKWLTRFAAAVIALPEVMEFHRMSGDVDYLLKVVTTDIGGYDRFYKKLIKTAHITGVSSAFSMEQIKYTTALPLDLILKRLPA